MIKNSYLLAGTRPSVLLRLIRNHKFSVHPKYLFRLLFLFQGSIWSSFFSHMETRRHGGWLSQLPKPQTPIFIVGHWRTGTTYLHQLMSLDPIMAAPTLFQCSYPDSFICSRRYAEPILSRFINGRRPMDNVKVGLDEPHEDEYALYRLTGFSPLSRLVFPESDRYFLVDDENFLPASPRLAEWEEALVFFVSKIAAVTGRRPVLKNPFHSLRIPVLVRLFPEALFLEISRDPLAVIPSTMHMWNIFGRQNALNGNWHEPDMDDVIAVYDRIGQRIKKDLESLPENRRAMLRFESLEKEPLRELELVYSRLGLDFSEIFRNNLSEFLEKNSGYKKNKYVLSREQEEKIRSHLSTV